MDTLHIEGILRIRELPEELWDIEEFTKWWPRFSEKERDRYTVLEARNLITSAGRSQVLTFIGNRAGGVVAFAQFYAVGTGAIFVVAPTDTALATELFRAAPSSFSVVGNQVTISTVFSTSQGNGVYTNAGLFGNGATSTPGSGTLTTHLLYSYTKTNANAITSDYSISLQ